MKLKTQMKRHKIKFSKSATDSVQETIKKAAEDLVSSNIMDWTIRVGDTLPSFSLKTKMEPSLNLQTC